MRINTNIASLTAQEAATNTNKALSASLEKLGSGLRINKAADDASGMSIADKLRTQASSLGQGISNANSASALIQIADKAMAEQSNILDIVKTKLMQASTSTTSEEGRESIRKDITKLLEQFDSIAAQTNYNGTTLLQKTAEDTAKADTFSFQLGEESNFNVSLIPSKANNTEHLGGGSDTIASGSNIAVGGNQQINTSSGVVLKDTNVDVTGTDTTGTEGLNIDLSGELGSVIATDSNTTFDASSQSSENLVALRAIADANTNFTETATAGTFSLTSGSSVSFGTIEFSSMTVKTSGADKSVEINSGDADVTFAVKNNNETTANPLLGQINIAVTTATGGSLLSDIKDLEIGGLTVDKANEFMSTVDEALTQLNTNRSDFGSTQNQLQSSVRNMQTTQTNLKAAESVIRDVDYAAESANFNKQNIISQAGTYAMSQANNVQQNIMKLLQ